MTQLPLPFDPTALRDRIPGERWDRDEELRWRCVCGHVHTVGECRICPCPLLRLPTVEVVSLDEWVERHAA